MKTEVVGSFKDDVSPAQCKDIIDVTAGTFKAVQDCFPENTVLLWTGDAWKQIDSCSEEIVPEDAHCKVVQPGGEDWSRHDVMGFPVSQSTMTVHWCSGEFWIVCGPTARCWHRCYLTCIAQM